MVIARRPDTVSVALGARPEGRKTAAYIVVMEANRPLLSIAEDALLSRLAELTRDSRRVEADLVAHIAEVDARRLYAREAAPSMFAYATERLHLSEAEAYLRIAAARASREHPLLLEMLGDGRLHLSAIALLAPHLTLENRDDVLRRASHRSKRQVEELVAELSPRPDVKAWIRKVPEGAILTATPSEHEDTGDEPLRPSQPKPPIELRPDGVDDREAAAPPPARPRPEAASVQACRIEPLSPARYRVQFTASASLREKLERRQALMRSSVPDGDLAAIVEAAVTEKLKRLEAKRFAQTATPRKTLAGSDTRATAGRHIPAAVRRAVRERDGDRCRFVDAEGRRCTERDRLEFHHRHPYGYGGGCEPGNIALLCRAHNAYVGEIDYGTRPRACSPRATAASP